MANVATKKAPKKGGRTKSATPDDTIQIPGPIRERIRITIEGTAQLNANPWTDSVLQQIIDKQGGKPVQKMPRVPEEEYAEKLAARAMRNGKARSPIYGFPCAGIKKSLVTAGFRFADGVKTQLNGLLFVTSPMQQMFTQINSKKTPTMGRHQGKPRGSGGTVLVFYRPEWETPWEMIFDVTYDAARITRDSIVNLVSIAGISVGLGPQRPENGGDCGTFRIKDVKMIKT